MAQLQAPVKDTQLKINLSFDIDGLTMDEYDFYCEFYTMKKAEKVEKADMIRLDGHNYLALVDTSKIGAGFLKVKATALVPDDDWPNGVRKEVARYTTDLQIYG